MSGAVDTVLTWLETVPPASAVRDSRWGYPLTEAAHITGLAIMVGAIVLFDLRLLGAARQLRVTALAGHALRWSRIGFTVVALTGSLMFMAHATQLAYNTVFQLKMLLIAAAGLNILLFHTGLFRDVKDWDADVRTPPSARAAAVISLTVWPAVIICGRLIAYVPTTRP
ncbi:DUF6644 family protein [Actinomadura alba]|uniref:DUF6644 domain-containing protein n=1 Tax=Actinomadura alba TaxID=406431 RepID=A0ABR7LKN4_9ACTN|nr:DUF6644 family protein [Actinomadura alba]MBC6465243.1 hypothetical protein [Actinomadura alba]